MNKFVSYMCDKEKRGEDQDTKTFLLDRCTFKTVCLGKNLYQYINMPYICISLF